jgi:hypothetical protein
MLLECKLELQPFALNTTGKQILLRFMLLGRVEVSCNTRSCIADNNLQETLGPDIPSLQTIQVRFEASEGILRIRADAERDSSEVWAVIRARPTVSDGILAGLEDGIN